MVCHVSKRATGKVGGNIRGLLRLASIHLYPGTLVGGPGRLHDLSGHSLLSVGLRV